SLDPLYDVGNVIEDLTNDVSVLGVTLLGGYVHTSATSTVTVGAATLTANGDVKVTAHAVSDGEVKTISTFLGVTYVHSAGTATATIGSDATIPAGGNSTLNAHVDNTMVAKTYAATGLSTPLLATGNGLPQGPAVAVSVGHAESTSKAAVLGGATVNAGNVDV